MAIDQFEEAFTQPSDPSDCRAFLDVLAVLTTAQDLQIRVVMGLRSDFYSNAAGYPWLADRISDNQMLVGPMRRHELRRAIELPAQRAGLRLELASRMRFSTRVATKRAPCRSSPMPSWRPGGAGAARCSRSRDFTTQVASWARSLNRRKPPTTSSTNLAGSSAAIVPSTRLAGRRRTRHSTPAGVGGTGRRLTDLRGDRDTRNRTATDRRRPRGGAGARDPDPGLAAPPRMD